MNLECDDPLPDADMKDEEYDMEPDLQHQAHDSVPDTAAAMESSGSPFMPANASGLQQSLPSLLPQASSAAASFPGMPPMSFPGPPPSAANGGPPFIQGYPAMQPSQHAPLGMPDIPARHQSFHAAPAPSFTLLQCHSHGLQPAYNFEYATTPQSQAWGHPRVRLGSHRGSKRKQVEIDGEAEKRQRVAAAWQSNGNLAAAVAAAEGSRAVASNAQAGHIADPVQTAVTSTAAAITSQGLSSGTQPAGSALGESVSLAGQAGASPGLSSSGEAGRLAASSFGSAQVHAAVAQTAGGIQSTYKFSF